MKFKLPFCVHCGIIFNLWKTKVEEKSTPLSKKTLLRKSGRLFYPLESMIFLNFWSVSCLKSVFATR